jgi:hypothetical protein
MRGIATRVRAIVAGRYGMDVRVAAAELGIGELDLRWLIELRIPPISNGALATLLTEVVRHFGVDPAWVVTGHYDISSHALADERSADVRALRAQIQRLLANTSSDRPVEIERVGGADRSPGASFEETRAPSGSAASPPVDDGETYAPGAADAGDERPS